MKLANITAINEFGEVEWEGTITSFVHANNAFPEEFPRVDWRALCKALRDGINTKHGRPEPVSFGGLEVSL